MIYYSTILVCCFYIISSNIIYYYLKKKCPLYSVVLNSITRNKTLKKIEKKITSILSLFPSHRSLDCFCVDRFKNLSQIRLSIKIEPKINNSKYNIGVDIKIQTIG